MSKVCDVRLVVLELLLRNRGSRFSGCDLGVQGLDSCIKCTDLGSAASVLREARVSRRAVCVGRRLPPLGIGLRKHAAAEGSLLLLDAAATLAELTLLALQPCLHLCTSRTKCIANLAPLLRGLEVHLDPLVHRLQTRLVVLDLCESPPRCCDTRSHPVVGILRLGNLGGVFLLGILHVLGGISLGLCRRCLLLVPLLELFGLVSMLLLRILDGTCSPLNGAVHGVPSVRLRLELGSQCSGEVGDVLLMVLKCGFGGVGRLLLELRCVHQVSSFILVSAGDLLSFDNLGIERIDSGLERTNFAVALRVLREALVLNAAVLVSH